MEKQRVSNNSETDLERVIRESGGKLRLSPQGNAYNRCLRSPREYSLAALAELNDQLRSARSATKVAKLTAKIRRWEATIAALDSAAAAPEPAGDEVTA